METPPFFKSKVEYRNRLNDVDFWLPYIETIFKRHGLVETIIKIDSGVGGTYPTFLVEQYVVKLFGFLSQCQSGFESELAAVQVISKATKIAAPRLLTSGILFEGWDESWPYIVTTRMDGCSWYDSNMLNQEKMSVAIDLGKQIKSLHKLDPKGVLSDSNWNKLDIESAVRRSSLPLHLVSQSEKFIAKLEAFDRVLVHSDLTARHVFVDNGNLVGIIDWGDAVFTDRSYELGKLYLDMFQCDKELLRAFLDASEWPLNGNICKQALGLAMYRQAVGLQQHFTFDMFHVVADKYPLDEINCLEELAVELFKV